MQMQQRLLNPVGNGLGHLPAPVPARRVGRNRRVRVSAISTLSTGTPAANASTDACVPTVCVPEDLQLPPGVLSTIDRKGKGLPQDVFRCFGCSKPECQVSTGCVGLLQLGSGSSILPEGSSPKEAHPAAPKYTRVHAHAPTRRATKGVQTTAGASSMMVTCARC